MRTLVTGASGFIGRRVVSQLAAHGHDVLAITRNLNSAVIPRAPGVAWRFVTDFQSTVDWAPLLEGVDAIVHLAGIAHVLDRADETMLDRYHMVNVEASVTLARAAAAARIGRFVFMSSVRVHGDPSDDTPLLESDRCEPVDAYGRSKLEAERALARIGNESGCQVVVLRAPLVYGPGVRANFLRMIAWIDRGWPLPFGAVANRRSLVYIDNLAAAIERSLTHPNAAGKTFLVSDGEDVSTAELAKRIGIALGRPARLINVPPRLMEWSLRCLGRGADYRRLFGSVAVDMSHLRTELGFKPPFNMQQGLAQTARWYRQIVSQSHGAH